MISENKSKDESKVIGYQTINTDEEVAMSLKQQTNLLIEWYKTDINII